MTQGDFYGSEKSCVMPTATSVAIELVSKDASVKVIKKSLELQDGEVIDASFMNVAELRSYFEREIIDAKNSDMLLSLVSSAIKRFS